MTGESVHPTILAAFFETRFTPAAMCCAGTALFLVGGWAAKKEIAADRGLDKIAALSNLCFAVPLAVFGTLHLFSPDLLVRFVPRYMPWRMFWVYFVGIALIAASLSIATKIAVRWSGLLVGIMMFMFVGMLYVPGALRTPHERIIWTIVCRESSFGAAGWILAADAINGWRGRFRSTLIMVGRIVIAIVAMVFGVEHFLHPLGLPGVPLQREMPAWIPGRALIDYVTGAALLITGASILLNRKTRTVATWAGGWILLLIIVMYGPVMIAGLFDPELGAKIEGIDYFGDTLLFAGVILAVANASPGPSSPADRLPE